MKWLEQVKCTSFKFALNLFSIQSIFNILGKVSDRTMQEAQNERQKLKDRISTVENNIDKALLGLQKGQAKVNRAREQKNKLNEEVLKIRQNQQESSQLKDKVNDLYKKETLLENSLKSLRQNLVIADEELESKVQELNDLKVFI